MEVKPCEKVINYYENGAFKVRGQSEGPDECFPEVKPCESSYKVL